MLTRPQLSLAGSRPVMGKRPDLSLLEDVVAARILDAMRETSARLGRLGVRHALVGALAVGAHGHPRATKDVDFVVGDEAFEHHGGGVVTMKPGVPIQVGGVAIDYLSARPEEEHLAADLESAIVVDEVPVASLGALAYLKLRSPRLKDFVDVVELVKAGAAVDRMRVYLERNAPALVERLEAALERARVEEDEA